MKTAIAALAGVMLLSGWAWGKDALCSYNTLGGRQVIAADSSGSETWVACRVHNGVEWRDGRCRSNGQASKATVVLTRACNGKLVADVWRMVGR